MPSIENLEKKREAIEREKRKIAERAAKRAAEEHEARLEAEGEALDWELEQVKAAEKSQEEARKQQRNASGTKTTDEDVKRLLEAAKAKARGGTPVKPKATANGGTPTTAQKSEEK